ncbi:phage portal protein [Bacillus subtilis]|uniref:phage portal protein n=1 Tax=Bacillus subtilis TaxID=1423 RepID=UPI002DBC25BC|nr:phage portal protein [Bacillus subtilis]MEC3621550.1 phage portal protein [Bacillus subtilis]MEC3633397.1 phage portal protein [Bacillus subtilis]MEC3643857.1 phage portal protein [Bacillus subtilis]MEC3648852.1 phage portal protein [Bacillus subtilis]MEC3698992.1 phage portal protein [Bacillus subtilis]
MIKKIGSALKAVMYRMGLIQGINKITDSKKVMVTDEHYEYVDTWYALYKGYHKDFHDITYKTVAGERSRRRATLNMPKVAAAEMAQLVFNEKCLVNVSDNALYDNIKEVLDHNKFGKQFQRYLEYSFALGGMVMKVHVDADQIKISYVAADAFYPLSSTSDEVTEGVFVNETRKGDKKYTLLEWHTWEGSEYVITNELYESNNSATLGIRVPLSTMYPDLEEEARIEGLTRPLFVYIRPNTANNFDMYSPLGISIYANALDTLKTLDIAYDSFQREFRLGKKRILVPQSAIKTVVDPQTGKMSRYFDAEDEAYQAMNFESEDAIKDISVELRVNEHIDAINSILNLLSMQLGFSAGTFTFDSQGLKTATEVVSENSKTFRTKNSHETIVEEGIKELVDVIVNVAELYDIFTAPDDYDVTVDFDDSIAEDRAANATYYMTLQSAGLISKKYALQRILDLTEEQAEEMLQEIKDENATADDAFMLDTFGQKEGQLEKDEEEEEKTEEDEVE